jgi:hypothetical protein
MAAAIQIRRIPAGNEFAYNGLSRDDCGWLAELQVSSARICI